MTDCIDKAFVRKSFNASAASYDVHAGLQQRLASMLIDFAGVGRPCLNRVLDIGMGTGSMTDLLVGRFSDAAVHGCDLAEGMISISREKLDGRAATDTFITADAEYLPYRPQSFDLVVSNFTYQWLSSWQRAFSCVREILKPGGLFAFSAFGPQTFRELRKSFESACEETGFHSGRALALTISEHEILARLDSCGFDEIETTAFTVVEWYPGVIDLVRAIKGMGARNASVRRTRSPAVRTAWKRMVELYEHHYGGRRGVAATFEIIMCRGTKVV